MNVGQRCRTCGGLLNESTASGGLCVRCLLQSGLASEPELEEADRRHILLPQAFGPYTLIEELGRGGMGVVYAARQGTLDRTVAIKLLLSGAYSSETALKRFRTEAAAAAGLQHPNIVEIHDYGEWESQPYYVMDLVAGRNLAQVCDGRPLPALRAANILRELADAVAYAHGKGILHRDLKPSNVLLDERDRPRITDFGLARRMDAEGGVTLSGQMLGSPSYASPEQAAGRIEEVGLASDIYGLGALFYHLLTGHAPFSAASPTDTLRLVLETDPPPPRLLNPALPRDLETICLKCLAKEPARRYATAAAVREDIDRFLQNRPIHARPPSVAYRSRKFVRRYRTGVIAVAAVVVALLAGLGGTFVSYRRAAAQERVAQAARARAQEMINFITQDLQPQLRAQGRRDAMLATARAAVRYFDQLPPELRDHATIRAHAVALDQLSLIYSHDAIRVFDRFPEEGHEVAKQSLAVWRQVAAQDPHDGDAATAVVGQHFMVQAYGSPPATGARLVALVQDTIARFRELERQYPDSARVQHGLARELIQLAILLSYGPKPETAIPLAAEARQRRERMYLEYPAERSSRYELALILGGSAIVYRNVGDFDSAVRMLEQGMGLVGELLEEDPTDVQSLALGATGALHLVWSLPSEQQKWEAARQFRSFTEILTTLDPRDPEWLLRRAEALHYDALFCRADRRLAVARDAIDLSLERMETLSPGAYDQSTRGDRLRMAGRCAAEEGDLAAARSRLGQLRDDFGDWLAAGGAAVESMKRKSLASFWQLDLIDALQDWAEMERLARDMLVQVDGSEVAPPVFRAVAEFFLGKALLKEGCARDAVSLLESAASYFQQAKPAAPLYEFAGPDNCEVVEMCVRALLQTGDRARAVGLLEWAFGKRDALVRAGGLLVSRIAAAQCAWQLAQALDPDDPAQAARRREVLDRAAELLDHPEVEPRLTPEERELRAQIGAALATRLSAGDEDPSP